MCGTLDNLMYIIVCIGYLKELFCKIRFFTREIARLGKATANFVRLVAQ